MKLTVQGWQNLVLSVIGLVVLVGAIGATVLVSRADTVSNEIRDTIQPARIAAYQLQAALRDQETAVRGYLLTADPRFLDPYNDGRTAEAAAAQQIRDSLSSYPDLLADLDAIDAAAATWRAEYADPMVTSVVPANPADVSEQNSEEGRVLFDRLRDLFAGQNEHLSEARVAGLAHLDQIRGWRDAVMLTMILAFFTMAVLLAVVIRTAVSAPLGALAAACRRITEGNFGERIIPRGPRDIRAIGASVEDMRQRIVDELGYPRPRRPRSPNRPMSCGARTPNSSSSPTSHPTICRSRCARWPPSVSCWRSATATNSMSAVPNTSVSPSTAPNGCRC